MRNRMRIVTCATLLALGSLAALPGCDWLKSSGSTERASPFISGLSISPGAVLCGAGYTVSFDYNDPQGDISGVTIFLALENDAAVHLDVSPTWPTNQSRASGNVSFPLSFTCGSRGGRYSVTVQLVDDRGHLSNLLTGTVTLSAAG